MAPRTDLSWALLYCVAIYLTTSCLLFDYRWWHPLAHSWCTSRFVMTMNKDICFVNKYCLVSFVLIPMTSHERHGLSNHCYVYCRLNSLLRLITKKIERSACPRKIQRWLVDSTHKGPAVTSGFSWWRHQMETFFSLVAICAGNSPVTGEFPAQRPVTRSFDVFFGLHLNKRSSEAGDLRRFRAHYDVTVLSQRGPAMQKAFP